MQKLADRITEFVNDLKGRKLNKEEKGLANIITGSKKFYHIRIDDLGNIIAFLKGYRDKTGANHIMLKHFGKSSQMGYISADEILKIGEIIRNGKLDIIN